jgi:uncharacterized membrane protein YeaQ/YmgE (transglycosylase-associated protein family)
MFETVSVDEAILKGTRMVVYPRFFFFIAGFGVIGYLAATKQVPGGYIFLGIILGLIAGWLYWSIASVKWKTWAYDNVRNVHELQKRAVKEGIIADDGNFWDSTTIKFSGDKEKLNSLQAKFDVPDVFTDDYQVPAETQIFYSKSKNLLGLIGSLVAICVFAYLAVKEKNYFLLAMIAVLLYFAYKELRNYTNTEPQITLNDEGIATVSTPFCGWKDIVGEDVIEERSGKSTTHNFVYSYPDGSEDINIGELDVTHHALENLLGIYRGRWEQKNDHKPTV